MTNVKEWLEIEWPEIKKGYIDSNIFNADETGLLFRCLPETTLKFKGETCNGGKMSKERLTVLLCSSSTGEKKTPLVIGKYLKPRCFKNQDLRCFKYFANKKAWMTRNIFINFLTCWDAELREKNRKILLILDNCTAHPDINSDLTNIKLVFLPPNTTSVLQPLDQGIIKSFKAHYRKILISKVLQNLELKTNFVVSILNALEYVKEAWDSVIVDTISHCFNHSNLMAKNNDSQASVNNHLREKKENGNILNFPFFCNNEDFNEYLSVDELIIKRETLEESVEDEISNEELIFEKNHIKPKSIKTLEAIRFLSELREYYSLRDYD